ncbi:MAG: family 78 glycoside hydrolase catalytic domain [Bacteroidales bacterium]
MKRLFIFLLVIAAACSGHQDNQGLSGYTDALWIGDGSKAPEHDSLFYLDDPAPVFRKEFNAEKEISSAVLNITAAGYYTATINGSRVGEDMFEPAWTDFSKRIYFSEYDITSLLQSGNNCLGVTLGNGFYNPLPLRMWGRRNLRNDLKVGRPVFIAQLIVEYEDGTTEEIVTDETWRFSHGPVLKNNVFLGEVYDARREIPGWNKPGFDDRQWENAVLSQEPGGELQKTFFPPMQVTQKIRPVQIYTCPSDPANYIVDMGINFTGTYRIKISGNTGDSITLRLGERIYEDGTLNPMTAVCGQIKAPGVGGPGAPDIAWQEDTYIVGDNTETWYSPEYTYHVFRYMEISGLEEMPQVSDIEGLFIHNNVTDDNHFSSSADLINSIQEMTERTFLANLISVQADCPAREKFGYGGDLNATSEAYIYNYDMQSLYRKTVYDWVDAMNDSVFVDTAPYVGIRYCGISWESAFILTQYYLYLYYNDTGIIEELYDLNNKWMDKVARIHPDKIVDQGLSDHGSLQPVPVQLIGTTHYLKSARIMQIFASVMGDKENEEKYSRLAGELKDMVKARFWDKPVDGPVNRQTLLATLLYYDIVPENEIPAARDSLLTAVRNGPSGHFNTGIFGTKYILDVLSRHGLASEVYDIVNSRTYPGWGHMIDNGATTIWETWQESENTYSNNHPMLGSVTEWFYKWLGGISPDLQNPGFKKFYLAPAIPRTLDHVNSSYQSPFGTIVSNWKKEGPGWYRYEMEIPSGSSAYVRLQVDSSQKINIEKISDNRTDEELVTGLQSGVFELDEGQYIITVKDSMSATGWTGVD